MYLKQDGKDILICSDDHRIIATVYEQGDEPASKQARQFSASDDLLAACKMWIAADELMNELDPTAYNDACIEAHRATRAAIAKASK